MSSNCLTIYMTRYRSYVNLKNNETENNKNHVLGFSK